MTGLGIGASGLGVVVLGSTADAWGLEPTPPLIITLALDIGLLPPQRRSTTGRTVPLALQPAAAKSAERPPIAEGVFRLSSLE